MHIIYSVLLFIYAEKHVPVDFPFNLHPLEQSLDVLRVRSLALAMPKIQRINSTAV